MNCSLGCVGTNYNGGGGMYGTYAIGCATYGGVCDVQGSSLFTKYESYVLS